MLHVNKRCSLWTKRNIFMLSIFLLVCLFCGFSYFAFIKKESNDIFTEEFKNSITSTSWDNNDKFTNEDFDILFRKLQNVSLDEIKEKNLTPIGVEPFSINMKTKEDSYSIIMSDNYIAFTSNYHIASDILGYGEPKVTYYRASKNITEDKEIKELISKQKQYYKERLKTFSEKLEQEDE